MSIYHGRNILVTGGSGLIGRALVQLLVERGAKVKVVSLDNPSRTPKGSVFFQLDLRDYSNCLRAAEDCEFVFHLAGIGGSPALTSGFKDVVERPYIHITDNAVMNSYLMRGALDNRIGQFILFSCTVMYHSRNLPHTETSFDPSRPITPNYFAGAWNKLYLEKIAEFYSTLGVTQYTAIRHSNIYGPNDKYDPDHSHVFGATVTKVMTSRDKIVVWGKGKEKRDFLHVNDLVNFVDLVISLQKTPFEIYCCGSGVGVSINELVKTMVRVSGRDVMVEHDLTKPTIPVDIVLDCSKAKSDLSWAPKVNLEKGIEQTFAWWKKNINNNLVGSDTQCLPWA